MTAHDTRYMKHITGGAGNTGQLLVEAMIAISLIVVGILGAVHLLSDALAYNRTVSNQYQAVYLAGEGIEVIRSMADDNVIAGRPWNSGLGNCQSGCEIVHNSKALIYQTGEQLRFQSGTFDYSGGTVTPFTRTVYITFTGGYAMDVQSLVTWSGRGGANFAVDLRDIFYDWR